MVNIAMYFILTEISNTVLVLMGGTNDNNQVNLIGGVSSLYPHLLSGALHVCGCAMVLYPGKHPGSPGKKEPGP